MKNNYKNNQIFKQEIKRTFPVYILGMFFHAICIYMLYKIPNMIGEILDLLLQGTIEKEIIMSKVYQLILYCVVFIIPRILYREMYFTRARISDTYLRKKVVEHLQYVTPHYYEKEEKGAYLAYLTQEILMVYKFFGNAFFNMTRLFIAPIIGIAMIGTNIHLGLALSVMPCIPIAIIWLFRLYQKLDKTIEKARVIHVEYANTIEQNTSGFSLVKLYNRTRTTKKEI